MTKMKTEAVGGVLSAAGGTLLLISETYSQSSKWSAVFKVLGFSLGYLGGRVAPGLKTERKEEHEQRYKT